MTTRTWNLKLAATEDRPETTIEGVSQEVATKVLRDLMCGLGTSDQLVNEHGRARVASDDHHEGPLAA